MPTQLEAQLAETVMLKKNNRLQTQLATTTQGTRAAKPGTRVASVGTRTAKLGTRLPTQVTDTELGTRVGDPKWLHVSHFDGYAT